MTETRRDAALKDEADRYYRVIDEMAQLRRSGEWRALAELTKREKGTFLGWIGYTLQEFGEIPAASPFLSIGLRALAVTGESQNIEVLARTVRAHPSLGAWIPEVESAEVDLRVCAAVVGLLKGDPGILQTDVKEQVNYLEPRDFSWLMAHLEEAGTIRREKVGRTYRLHPAN